MNLSFVGLLNGGVIFSRSRTQQMMKPYYVFTICCDPTESQQGSKPHRWEKGPQSRP